jgi:hypothetical protein
VRARIADAHAGPVLSLPVQINNPQLVSQILYLVSVTLIAGLWLCDQAAGESRLSFQASDNDLLEYAGS